MASSQKTILAVAAGAAALSSTAFVQSGPAGQAAPERSSVQLRGRIAAQTSASGSSAPSFLGCTAAASASEPKRPVSTLQPRSRRRLWLKHAEEALLAAQLRGKRSEASYGRKSQVVVSAFENELGVQDPVGFWDPAGFTADGSVENFKRRRQTELKHGRISMLATMGYITPEITGKFPGYLSPSAGLKFADVPNGLAAISKVPAAGWGQILAYMAFCEVSQDQSPGTPAAAGDFGFKVLTSSDPAEKTKKLSAELANGRLAMMAIIGMFFQDGLTGSAWGDWANYTASPLRAEPVSAAAAAAAAKAAAAKAGASAGAKSVAASTGVAAGTGKSLSGEGEDVPPEPAFDPASEVGVTEPFGYFDPAGFCKKGDKAGFRNLRAAEIKHGRVAMMAAVGAVFQHYVKFPGFESVPAGLGAVEVAPGTYGFAALFAIAGLLELGAWTEDPSKEPGNFGDPAGLNQYTLEMRNRELNNGRMAMFAAIGIIAANVYTGKDAIEQFGLA